MLALVVAMLLTAGLIFYVGRTGGSTHVPAGKPGIGFTVDPVNPDAGGR